jgi:hypothetical protein
MQSRFRVTIAIVEAVESPDERRRRGALACEAALERYSGARMAEGVAAAFETARTRRPALTAGATMRAPSK